MWEGGPLTAVGLVMVNIGAGVDAARVGSFEGFFYWRRFFGLLGEGLEKKEGCGNCCGAV